MTVTTKIGRRVRLGLGALAALTAALTIAPQPVHTGTDGTLDRSFGIGGKTLTTFGGQSVNGFSVAIQADGRIVTAGTATSAKGDADFAVARFLPNGSLDPTFGGSGKVTTDFGGREDAFSLVLQADGKIVVAGPVNQSGNTDFGLARYNTDGSLDLTFDGDGKVTTSFLTPFDVVQQIAIQPDGKIVAAGSLNRGIGTNADFALARYNTDGSLDATFGTGGTLTTDFSDPLASTFAIDFADALVLQPDGRIIVAGATSTGGIGGQDFALARYQADGSLDTSFGTNGLVVTEFEKRFAFLHSVDVYPDGRIVASGVTVLNFVSNWALARYHADGSPDASFGSHGMVIDPVLLGRANVVKAQADGTLLVAGSATPPRPASPSDFALARYLPDGTLDPSFGRDGSVLTDFARGSDAVLSIALQPDGRIVAAGGASINRQLQLAVARYDSAPRP